MQKVDGNKQYVISRAKVLAFLQLLAATLFHGELLCV